MVIDDREKILELNPFKELDVRPMEIGLRADVFLAKRLPWRSRNDIQNLLDAEKITLRGNPVKASYRVRLSDKFWLSIISPKKILGDNASVELDTIYEDEHIVVINKAPGLVVHPSGRRLAGTVIQAVFMRMRDEMRDNPDLRPRLLHRIDRETSGVLVLSKYDEIHRVLQQMFERRKVSKQYLAIVEGVVEQDTGRIDLPLAHDRSSRIGVKMAIDEKRGMPSRTDYAVVERLPGYTLVAARPLTGRQHQIRVHFAAIGHPVVDDLLYKDEKVFLEYVKRDLKPPEGFAVLGRHGLHAQKITFYYAPEGREATFEAPLTSDMARFVECLRNGVPFRPERTDDEASAEDGKGDPPDGDIESVD